MRRRVRSPSAVLCVLPFFLILLETIIKEPSLPHRARATGQRSLLQHVYVTRTVYMSVAVAVPQGSARQTESR